MVGYALHTFTLITKKSLAIGRIKSSTNYPELVTSVSQSY
jgi:hypothetical protein